MLALKMLLLKHSHLAEINNQFHQTIATFAALDNYLDPSASTQDWQIGGLLMRCF